MRRIALGLTVTLLVLAFPQIVRASGGCGHCGCCPGCPSGGVAPGSASPGAGPAACPNCPAPSTTPVGEGLPGAAGRNTARSAPGYDVPSPDSRPWPVLVPPVPRRVTYTTSYRPAPRPEDTNLRPIR